MPATNNDFSSAITISGATGSISPDADLQTSNTTETGEPTNTSTIKQTVWYSWTAPSSGRFKFVITPTLSSGRYAYLAVYTGSAVNALTPIEFVFAEHGGSVPLTFDAVSGTTYKIQIGVYQTPAVAGTAALAWDTVPPPANDDFVDAIEIGPSLPDAEGPINITGATLEGSEPSPSGGPTPIGSAWYKYVAAASGGLRLEISAAGDSPGGVCAAIYTGASLGALTEVANTGYDYYVSLPVTSGVTYWIQAILDGGGDTEVTVSLDSVTIPANDLFANATVLTGHTGTIDGTTVNASKDFPAEEGFSGGANVWYKWTAVADGPATFDTLLKPADPPTNIDDTTLTIYTGTNFSDLTLVEQNDDSGDPDDPTNVRSKVSFYATEGTDYWIEVAALSNSGDDGEFTLRWRGIAEPYETSMLTEWKIGVYNKTADAKLSTSFDGTVTDEFLKHVTDVRLTYTLNGIDQLEFSLLLDDPAALNITKKTTFIRVWRFINDVENSKTRSPDWSTPDFCGVVTGITKSGEEGKMTVTVQGVLWLVQVHFHLLNYRLVNDPVSVPSYREGSNETGLGWDHSALMFHLIDLINGAWKYSGGDTGIRRPPTADYTGTGYMSGLDLYWPQTIQVPVFYINKGTYTWALLYNDLLSRDSSPDIVPQYIYSPGSIDVMYFKTAIIRGTDKTGTVSFDYRTGQKNIADVNEQAQVVPGEYANFVWISGDGGPNGNLLATADDTSDISDNGIFMKHDNIPGAKLTDVQDVASATIKSAAQADAEIYTVSMSPAAPLYYDLDYTLGDLVSLNADKGALQVENKPQRIYQATLSWSDNNVESTELMISNDFKRKFV